MDRQILQYDIAGSHNHNSRFEVVRQKMFQKSPLSHQCEEIYYEQRTQKGKKRINKVKTQVQMPAGKFTLLGQKFALLFSPHFDHQTQQQHIMQITNKHDDKSPKRFHIIYILFFTSSRQSSPCFNCDCSNNQNNPEFHLCIYMLS